MIAVCGPQDATEQELVWAAALGRAIAGAGHALVCGGRGGVMEAACRGAKLAGGSTVGILPGYDRSAANRWVDHAICTGLGEARNALVVASGQVVVAVSGGFGTLSEIGLALKMGRTVVALGSWELDPGRLTRFGGDARYLEAASPEEALDLALEAIADVTVRLEAPPSSHG
ncbi:MAG TPA: TIGR00725 family protein [Thermomicrobiaceae bacterium]|nr:TIGR00725 family protein [Thermomicrobiaceae bacterium]